MFFNLAILIVQVMDPKSLLNRTEAKGLESIYRYQTLEVQTHNYPNNNLGKINKKLQLYNLPKLLFNVEQCKHYAFNPFVHSLFLDHDIIFYL